MLKIATVLNHIITLCLPNINGSHAIANVVLSGKSVQHEAYSRGQGSDIK